MLYRLEDKSRGVCRSDSSDLIGAWELIHVTAQKSYADVSDPNSATKKYVAFFSN